MSASPMDMIRQDVQSMHAYAIQDSTGMVKLDAMENPYPLPPALQAGLGARLGAVAIHRYPGARIDELKQALVRYVDLPSGCGLMLGNGSDELISLLAMGCDLPGASILAPLPGFVMYAMSAQLQGLKFVGVPLTADFELDEAGKPTTLADFKGQVVVMNLWATWCAPCIEELPPLAALQTKYKGRINVLALSFDNNTNVQNLSKFMAKHNAEGLPFAYDGLLKVRTTIPTQGLPTSLIIDPNGEVIVVLEGHTNWVSDKALAFFESILTKS